MGQGMTAYVARRLGQLLPVLLVASLLVFAMIYAVPGGPVAAIVGENATSERIEAVTHELGLDRPVLAQYAIWLKNALVGNLGASLHTRALALGVPTFWVGILLILSFAVELRLLPSASAYVPFWQDPWQALRNTLLPALTLGLYVSGIFARFLRASLIAE